MPYKSRMPIIEPRLRLNSNSLSPEGLECLVASWAQWLFCGAFPTDSSMSWLLNCAAPYFSSVRNSQGSASVIYPVTRMVGRLLGHLESEV